MAAAPPAPLVNPNTSHQPTAGVHHDPSGARVEGLQVEQFFAYNAVSDTIDRLKPTLSLEDYTALETVEDLLHDGGTQVAIEAGADTLESTLAHLTPVLGANDLAALNAALASMRFLNSRLRTGASLPALPEAEPEPPAARKATPPAAPPARSNPAATGDNHAKPR
jgi:hypothetical protein